jgi:hypothetical protein
MALGVMGVGAGSAQAVKPTWDVNGEALLLLLPDLGIVLPTAKPYLLSVIVGIHFELECKGAERVLEGVLKGPNLVRGMFRFTGCAAYTNKLDHATKSAACEPEGGEVITTPLLGELKAGENNVVLIPTWGTEIATIKTSSTCAVGEEIPIEGVFAVKDSDGVATGLEVNKTEHKFEGNPAKSTLTALGEAAAIVGTAKVKFEGIYSGQSWRGLP